MIRIEEYPEEVRGVLREQRDEHKEFEFALSHARRALLYGPAGTHKSSMCAKFGLEGRGVVRTFITAETAAAQITGHWLPGASGTQWMDGPGTRAWRSANRLVVDEIDQAGGDTIPALHAFADDEEIASITLANGETIVPHGEFQFFATMNSTPVALPEALRDRFVVKLHVRYPNPEMLSTFPNVIRNYAAMGIYTPALKALPGLESLASTRTWVEIAFLVGKRGLGFADALRAIGLPNAKKLAEKVHSAVAPTAGL